ncbi:FecR family protein [Chryseosolibacter indicus]|uniref:FecR domain-containing protein n=1 Tax=Chryseosolibacter indicus TaxID=2782351 RepID=A0ABS5VXE8_9BACT|nr:FecR family protein [Chryseosolibacter indicus]MBT1706082.1 FecR domain-containing protein [Chryseosolibacter indicus]
MQEENGLHSISALIAKKLAGEMTEAEQSELDQWIKESVENERLYNTVIDPVNKLKRDQFLQQIDVQADWQKLSAKVFKEKGGRQINLLWYKVAAAITFVCIAAGAFYFKNKAGNTSSFEEQIAKINPGTSQAIVRLHNGKTITLSDSINQDKQFEEANGVNLYNSSGGLSYDADDVITDELIFNEIVVPRGGEYKITLSDGTKVWLNSETQLKFPVKFAAKERTVELTGEAYFEVAHMSEKPFIVNTLQQGEVKVYGTQFNINAYADNAQVYVTLNEGKVSVRKIGDSELMLKPDEQAVLGEKVSVVKVDASQYSAWKDGLLVFDNVSFHQISQLLARWYDVEFEFESEAIKNYRFTADIKRYGTFRDVLRVFEKTDRLNFEVEGKVIKVISKKDG